MRLEQHTILITGAASGIGRATAIRLASEGARLELVDRDEERLLEVFPELNGQGHSRHICDVTDEPAIQKLADNLSSTGVVLNGLVHCAGIHWLRPLQVTDSVSLNEMLTSHIVSSVALARALVMKRLAAKTGCSVVLFSSAAALQGGAGALAYSAAKGALISACRVLAVELAKRKIRVNVIAPGVVRTPQSAAFLGNLSPEQVSAIEASHLLGIGEPEDIAGVVAFLQSQDARWITGSTLVVDGGLTAH